jgi:SAM-dependent methyltransferase
MEPSGANAEQIRYWNETAGPKWVTFQRLLDDQLEPFGRHVMERAAIATGERVIDVGCGCGATTMALARRVGPTGLALGIDISTAMLERARESAREAGLTQARFENADAQTHTFTPGGFDLIYSRFGVMFFADPPAAFANLRSGLPAGGRLAFVCWQALWENPWIFEPLKAAAQHITLPAPPAPDAPGPFAFADPGRVRSILATAGFVDVGIEELRGTLTLGGTAGIDEAVHLLLEGVGPTSAALREADPAVRPKVFAAVRDAIASFATPEGVRMGSAAWIVTARR